MKKKPARKVLAANPANKHWHAVCSMERPLTSIENFVNVLCFFAESLDEQNQGLAMQEVCYGIKGHLDVIKETRGRLFHDLHPAPELGRRMRAKAKRRKRPA